jgi:hypothetical protein
MLFLLIAVFDNERVKFLSKTNTFKGTGLQNPRYEKDWKTGKSNLISNFVKQWEPHIVITVNVSAAFINHFSIL